MDEIIQNSEPGKRVKKKLGQVCFRIMRCRAIVVQHWKCWNMRGKENIE